MVGFCALALKYTGHPCGSGMAKAWQRGANFSIASVAPFRESLCTGFMLKFYDLAGGPLAHKAVANQRNGSAFLQVVGMPAEEEKAMRCRPSGCLRSPSSRLAASSLARPNLAGIKQPGPDWRGPAQGRQLGRMYRPRCNVTTAQVTRHLPSEAASAMRAFDVNRPCPGGD
jgi:hypothetical protein